MGKQGLFIEFEIGIALHQLLHAATAVAENIGGDFFCQ